MSGTIFHDDVPFGGATSVDTLVDVNLGTNGPSDGDILVYDEETGMWKPSGNLGTLNSNKSKVDKFTINVTTTPDGLAQVTVPTGVTIDKCMSCVCENTAGQYKYALLIKQTSALWVDIRYFDGTAYVSGNADVTIFYYV